jgi:hypothetical protein
MVAAVAAPPWASLGPDRTIVQIWYLGVLASYPQCLGLPLPAALLLPPRSSLLPAHHHLR